MGFVSLPKGPVNDSVTLCHFFNSPEITTFPEFGVGDIDATTGVGTADGDNENVFTGVVVIGDVIGDEVGSFVGSSEKI